MLIFFGGGGNYASPPRTQIFSGYFFFLARRWDFNVHENIHEWRTPLFLSNQDDTSCFGRLGRSTMQLLQRSTQGREHGPNPFVIMETHPLFYHPCYHWEQWEVTVRALQSIFHPFQWHKCNAPLILLHENCYTLLNKISQECLAVQRQNKPCLRVGRQSIWQAYKYDVTVERSTSVWKHFRINFERKLYPEKYENPQGKKTREVAVALCT